MRWLVAIPLFLLALIGPHLALRQGDLAGAPLWGASSLDFPGAVAAPSRRALGPFRVEVLAVLDGDTVEVRFMEGPCGRLPCVGQEASIRILNVDAPEAHRCRSRSLARSGGASCAACEAEHELGQQALAFTRDLVKGRAARTLNVRPDKYAGRVVADLEVLKDGRWVPVGATLIEAGFAVPYDGRRKNKPWCAQGAR
jgi:endonuclease YncB( thermonuclease family)